MAKSKPLVVHDARAWLQAAGDAVADGSCACSERTPTARCCRFDVTGREPWLTEVEWHLVKKAWARTGRREPSATTDAWGSCPFLSSAGRCLVYDDRPLGCRTFFCADAEQAPSAARSALLEVARNLSAASTQPSRPLRSWLAESRR
jgi:uncharacterized protein